MKRYWDNLTPTQAETVLLIAEGLTNEEIAHRTGLPLNAAKRRVSTVFHVLNLPPERDQRIILIAEVAKLAEEMPILLGR